MCVHIVYSQHVGMTDEGVMRTSQGGSHIVRSARWQVAHTVIPAQVCLIPVISALLTVISTFTATGVNQRN